MNAKFEYALLTNIGCECQFSKLDNHINNHRRNYINQDYLYEHTVASNAYLLDSDLLDFIMEEKRSI